MTLTQTPVSKRITELDALRGFALFGILIVNILYFAHPFMSYFMEESAFSSSSDKATLLTIQFLFEGKFITLFSIMFGLGFTMMATRFLERDLPFNRVFYRRVFMLILFGAAHIWFFWAGDILFIYGICALLLPLFLNRKEKTIKRWIGIFLIVPFILFTLFALFVEMGMQMPEVAEDLRAVQAETQQAVQDEVALVSHLYVSSNWSDILQARKIEAGWMFKGMLFSPGGYFYVMAMFLIGVLMGKLNYARRIEEKLPEWRRHLKKMLPAGLILAAAYVYLHHQANMLWIDAWHIPLFICMIVGTPLLTLSYAILFTGGYKSFAETWLGRGLAAVGRTALSNYLLQSVIATTLFYGYGFGLYGSLSLPVLVLIALLIFAFQLVLSSWYITRFKMGPAEWFWRLITYWKVP